MNFAGILFTALCVGIIILSIYILARNIKNQLNGKGCGSCRECGRCSGGKCGRKNNI